jgi:phage terminase small subunit
VIVEMLLPPVALKCHHQTMKDQQPNNPDTKQQPWHAGLNPKEVIFVENVVKGVSLTKSAIEAGYSKSAAGRQGSMLNKKDYIKAAIQQLMATVAIRIEISAEKILQEVAAIAHSNMRDVASWGANGVLIKESSSLSSQASSAIAEVYDAPKRGKGVKLYDKLSALKLLGEYVGIFKKDSTPTATGPTIKVYAGIDPTKV